MTETKSHTVPVQFQYGARSTYGNSLQDHHTLCTSYDSYDSKAGRSSTCTHKYFMEHTSSTLCTCPQATKAGLQTRGLISLEKSQAPTQWKDFCQQIPIDKVRHSVTLFLLLLSCSEEFQGISFFIIMIIMKHRN